MSKHTAAIVALCFAVFCQTYLFLSVFTYSGFMAIFLIPGLTKETAGSYAGILSSSYMIGRTVSAYSWGKIADTIGRKPVFYISFLVPAIFSIGFGLSTSLSMALCTRFIMGLGNGLMLVAKTTVSELAKGDDQLEAKGMGLVMGMWGYGFLICPAISGVLSEPVKQYPDSALVHYFESFLSRYPFILPNLFGVFLCVVGCLTVFFFVEETLPVEKRKSVGSILAKAIEGMQAKFERFETNNSKEELLPLNDSSQKKLNYTGSEHSLETDALTGTDDSSKGTNNDLDEGNMPHTESRTMLSTSIRFDKSALETPSDESDSQKSKKKQPKASISSLWARPATRHHLMCFWMLSYISIVLDEVFPLFSIAANGGLNLTETGIGEILSGAGLIFVLCQYSTYSFIMSRYGLFTSIIIGSALATPVTFLIPFSLLFNTGAATGTLPWSVHLFISAILGCKNVAINFAFSSLTIATNRSVPSHQRASVNGLSVLGGSFTKAAGPVTAGLLVTFMLGGSVFTPMVGAFALFGVLSLYGILCVFFVLTVLKQHYKDGTFSTVES